MKRVTFKNSRGLRLVGRFYKGSSKSAVIMSHGFTGDKSEWGRFDRTAEALNKAGFTVFSFDFSGCGESEDDSLTVEKQVDDLQSAIDFIKQKGFKKLGLLGHSLGGLISLKNLNKGIRALVLWAPATAPKMDIQSWYSRRQLKEMEDTGYLVKKRDMGVRRKFIIEKGMFDELASINQEKLLSKVKCPVLIIHGDKDDVVPVENSQQAMQYLPAGSKLEVIKGADHSFYEQLDKFIGHTVEWFKRLMIP